MTNQTTLTLSEKLRAEFLWRDVALKELAYAAADEIDRLKERDDFLCCLEACGVDNWGGFSDAKKMQKED